MSELLEELHPDTREAKIRALNAEANLTEIEAKIKAHELAAFENHSSNNLIYTFYGSVSTGRVQDCIENLDKMSRLNPGKPITVILNSPGGFMTDGFALFDFIREISGRGNEMTGKVIGVAASMGAILLQAFDKRVMSKNSYLMLHEAATEVQGSSSQIDDTTKLLKRFEDRTLDIFAERSSLNKVQIKRLYNRRDSWLDAEQSLAHGFVDEIQN